MWGVGCGEWDVGEWDVGSMVGVYAGLPFPGRGHPLLVGGFLS